MFGFAFIPVNICDNGNPNFDCNNDEPIMSPTTVYVEVSLATIVFGILC